MPTQKVKFNRDIRRLNSRGPRMYTFAQSVRHIQHLVDIGAVTMPADLPQTQAGTMHHDQDDRVDSYDDDGDSHMMDILDDDYTEEPSPPSKPKRKRRSHKERIQAWQDVHYQCAAALARDHSYFDGLPYTGCPDSVQCKHDIQQRQIHIIGASGLHQGPKVMTLHYPVCQGFHFALVRAGYFPTSATRPQLAFHISWLQLFHCQLMTGRLSKYAWVSGFARHLEIISAIPLPNLHRSWDYAYFNWRQSMRIATKICTSQSRFQPQAGSLAYQCAACFHRKADSGDNLYFLSIDGNLQHKRSARVSKGQPIIDHGDTFEPEAEKLKKPSPEDLQEESAEVKSTTCPTHLAAYQSNFEVKPKSLVGFDETGLIAIVCRHGIPLRYGNLYRGENYPAVRVTLRHVLQQVVSSDQNARFIVQYDIGCRFGNWFKQKEVELGARCTFALNSFHTYGHSLDCQLKYGPMYQMGIGRSDGEGCENNWSTSTGFVSMCIRSSAQTRLNLLDYRNTHIAGIRRVVQARTLGHRLKRVLRERAQIARELSKLYPDGLPADNSLLQSLEEQLSRRRAFLNEPQRLRTSLLNSVNDLLYSQPRYKDVWKRLCELQSDLNPQPPRDSATHELVVAEGSLPSVDFSRDNEDALVNHELLQADPVERSKKPKRSYKPGPDGLWQNVTFHDACNDTRLGTLIQRHAYTSSEWKSWLEGGELWKHFNGMAVVTEWIEIASQYQVYVALRKLLLEKLCRRFNVRGQDMQKKLLTHLSTQSIKIREFASKAKQLSLWLQTCCSGSSPAKVVERAPPVDRDTFNLEQLAYKSGQPLWKLEAELTTLTNSTESDDALKWLYDSKKLAVMEWSAKRFRTEEEIHILKAEMFRLARYAYDGLSNILKAENSACVMHHPNQGLLGDLFALSSDIISRATQFELETDFIQSLDALLHTCRQRWPMLGKQLTLRLRNPKIMRRPRRQGYTTLGLVSYEQSNLDNLESTGQDNAHESSSEDDCDEIHPAEPSTLDDVGLEPKLTSAASRQVNSSIHSLSGRLRGFRNVLIHNNVPNVIVTELENMMNAMNASSDAHLDDDGLQSSSSMLEVYDHPQEPNRVFVHLSEIQPQDDTTSFQPLSRADVDDFSDDGYELDGDHDEDIGAIEALTLFNDDPLSNMNPL